MLNSNGDFGGLTAAQWGTIVALLTIATAATATLHWAIAQLRAARSRAAARRDRYTAASVKRRRRESARVAAAQAAAERGERDARLRGERGANAMFEERRRCDPEWGWEEGARAL